MDLAQVRRGNLLRLFSEFITAQQAKDPSASPTGLDKAFALQLQVHNTYFSGMKSGARAIGDKLARQIESNTGKRKGWLDEDHAPAPARSKELERFLELAEQAWRASDKDGRERLRNYLKEASEA